MPDSNSSTHAQAPELGNQPEEPCTCEWERQADGSFVTRAPCKRHGIQHPLSHFRKVRAVTV
jgi:hypothetical protein